MGLVSIPSMTEYRKMDSFFGQDFVRNSSMTHTKFLNILAAVHLSDLGDTENDSRRENVQTYDPLFKLKPLLQDLELASAPYYVAKQAISIDEQMGTIGVKQNVKVKPTKWGFKLWILADSDNGYTNKF